MIKEICIENYKSINRLELFPRAFNLLTGTNSSGKSSAIQSLLLLTQNLENPYGLNGPLTTIGEFREVKNFNIKEKKISVVARSNDEEVQVIFSETGTKIKGKGNALGKWFNYSNNHVHYLSCNRVGSRDLFFKNRTLYKGVGVTGEYTIDYLSENGKEPLEEPLVKDLSDYTLLAQVNYWLKYIVDANIRIESVPGTEAVKASYSMVEGRDVRPQNVGSGISYVISIIVQCLASKEGDILIIENPEIHLHPLSQSRLCEFLYFISQHGRQLFIETHSDHFFNAVRAGIATKRMKKEDILIEFFKLGSDNCTRKYDIEIGKYGAIENQIPNLFDQFQIDMDKMIGGFRSGSNNQ